MNPESLYEYAGIATPPPFNVWQHICLSYDGANFRVHQNGILVGIIACSGSYIANNVLFIGNWQTAEDFAGDIDEFRIWNRSLSQTEIQSNMYNELTGNESGLIGYWNFNEGSGSTLADKTSNGNDGTIYGASWSTDYPTVTETSVNYSLSFDGVDDYVEIMDAETLSPSSFTLELWVNQPVLSDERGTLIFKDDSNNHVEYSLMENQTGIYTYVGYDLFLSSRHLNNNQWTHIASTFDETTGILEIFVDGVSIGSDSIGASVINTTGNLYLGWFPSNPSYNALTGIIDEIRISDIVRYTDNFAIPSYEFSNDEHTIALYHLNEGAGDSIFDASGNGNDGTIYGATWSSDVPLDIYPEIMINVDSVTAFKNDTVNVGINIVFPVDSSFSSAELSFEGFQGNLEFLEVDTTSVKLTMI